MSYGDDIMTTGLVRRLKIRFPKSNILIGDGEKEYLSPVFLHNPNIDHGVFVKKNVRTIWIKDYPSHRPYINYALSNRHKSFFNKFKPLKGQFFFSRDEIANAKQAVKDLSSFVVIEPNIRSTYSVINRDWGFTKWQQVVDKLHDKIIFVQLGPSRTKTLKGVLRIMTKDFRSACAVLSFANLFVGTEGGLHHAAAALDVKGVIIFGGRVSPQILGYRIHTNLYADLPGSPCGKVSKCDHCKKCLDRISVRQVVDSIKCYLKQR